MSDTAVSSWREACHTRTPPGGSATRRSGSATPPTYPPPHRRHTDCYHPPTDVTPTPANVISVFETPCPRLVRGD